MDYKAEITRLAAENIALQTLVMGLLNSLIMAGNGKLAEGAFYYADMVLEAGAIHLGSNAPREHTVGAMEVLEQLRAALVPSPEHQPES